MLKVAVTGAAGLLGTTLVPFWRRAGESVVEWTRRDFDVTDARAVNVAVRHERPDVLIHAAAYTDVDRAELEPEVALQVNGEGTAIVAAACCATGTLMVYLSTDYVFDGEGRIPIPPEAVTRPVNAYGRSKAVGEAAVQASGAAHAIVRSGWMYGPGGDNFVDTIRAAAEAGHDSSVVDDQSGAPTAAHLLAEVLLALVRRRATGCWHVASAGEVTWYEVARTVYQACDSGRRVFPIGSAQRGGPARRPAYTVLDCGATARYLGIELPNWRDQLVAYVREGRTPGLGLVTLDIEKTRE